MKKLSIIAGLVFTTVFFASCEKNEVMPQNNDTTSTSKIEDFVEPGISKQKSPNAKTYKPLIIKETTELISTFNTHKEK